MYCYEIKCRCGYDDWYKYFYITSPFVLKSLKDTGTNKVPEKLKLVIDDYYLRPVEIKRLNAVEYFYDKYFKKEFHLGSKIEWEKMGL